MKIGHFYRMLDDFCKSDAFKDILLNGESECICKSPRIRLVTAYDVGDIQDGTIDSDAFNKLSDFAMFNDKYWNGKDQLVLNCREIAMSVLQLRDALRVYMICNRFEYEFDQAFKHREVFNHK